jgi:hypothetical protein
MDMRKYSSTFIKPDDVRDGPRREKIVHIYESEKYGRPVLELESGDQFSLNDTNNKTLIKAWGFDGAGWLGQELELTLGHYKDWNSDSPEEKETVVVRAISVRDPARGNGERPSTQIMPRAKDKAMDDEIPF